MSAFANTNQGSELYDAANECRHCGSHVADPHAANCLFELGIATDGDTPLFWCNDAGNISCFAHIGGYGTAAITANPTRDQWKTPLNHWLRVTPRDRVDWREEFGTPMTCETCARVRPTP